MIKKIGILTHYYGNQNLGALLQAYALVTFLLKKNFIVKQIPFNFRIFDAKAKRLRSLFQKETHQGILYLGWGFFRLIAHIFTKCQKQYLLKELTLQRSLIKKFANDVEHQHFSYSDFNIQQANNHFDTFIIGSDQVWASYLLPHQAFWGEFTTPNKKVISYAASSNRKQFTPQAEKLFVTKLARLNAISVREKTLKDYIEHITDKKATVVLDPTFLLSAQEWLTISNPAPVPQKPYIFCYFLGGKSAWQRQMAQSYADKYGYEVVHLPYIRGTVRSADRFLKGQGRYDVGPREFIALINGAQCVFTDSFHGLAFSINLGKNFYVFNRDDQSGPQSMNARITDTLATFGLTSRHITDKNAALDNKQLDFTKTHEVLACEKEFSSNWLLNALKD